MHETRFFYDESESRTLRRSTCLHSFTGAVVYFVLSGQAHWLIGITRGQLRKIHLLTVSFFFFLNIDKIQVPSDFESIK